ncbi:MAG: hypothetical protein QOF13_2201 [Solirubrobacterales bacterium]|nr:hypothetical protein [Solirubrobacterales bacterium]
MAVSVDANRRLAQWWRRRPDVVRHIEGDCWQRDFSLSRLAPAEIVRNPDLRPLAANAGVLPTDLLAYSAIAAGRFGIYRIAALFPLEPDDAQPLTRPRVYCLDGPRGLAASEHRHSDIELCLYFPHDPPERRWNLDQGLWRLLGLARQHLICEEYVRRTGEPWPIDAAPHGPTEPLESDPSLALGLPSRPGRNELCSCGSGKKSKVCCCR